MFGFLKSRLRGSTEPVESNKSNTSNQPNTVNTKALDCFVNYMKDFRMVDDYFEEHEYDRLKYVVLMASENNNALQNLIKSHPSRFSNDIINISEYFKTKSAKWYDKQTSFSWIYNICTHFAFFYGSGALEGLVNRVHDSPTGFALNNDEFFKRYVKDVEDNLKVHLPEIGSGKTTEEDLIKFYVNLSTVLQIKAFESDLRKNLKGTAENFQSKIEGVNNEKYRTSADFLFVGCAFLIALDLLLPNLNLKGQPTNEVDWQMYIYILYLKAMANLAYEMTKYISTVQNEKVGTIFSIPYMNFITDVLVKKGPGFETLFAIPYNNIIEEYRKFAMGSK